MGLQPFGGSRASGTNDKATSLLEPQPLGDHAHDQGDVRAADGLALPVDELQRRGRPLMSEPFQKLHHLCIVVHDIERAIGFDESAGIGPWLPYPPLGDFTDLETPDPEGFRGLDYRYAWVGELQLQLCQPGPEPTPQRQFLDARGEGVFHVGFEVPDADAADRPRPHGGSMCSCAAAAPTEAGSRTTTPPSRPA